MCCNVFLVQVMKTGCIVFDGSQDLDWSHHVSSVLPWIRPWSCGCWMLSQACGLRGLVYELCGYICVYWCLCVQICVGEWVGCVCLCVQVHVGELCVLCVYRFV